MNYATTCSAMSIVELELELLDLFAPMTLRRGARPTSSADQAALWRLDAIHRAKNLAQLSVSLSNIAANRSHRWSATEIAGPARTLARTYDALTIAGDLAKPVPCLAIITEIATQLTCMFGKARGVRVDVTGDEVHMPPECRRALALTCSELIINALKYAFPGGGPGRIVVQLTPGRPAIEMVVRDDGVGLSATRVNGLGSGLLDRLATVSGATLRRGPGLNGGGHGVTMRIPMPHP